MNTLKDYVDWKLTHPQGYMSRNIYHADIVFCVPQGWNLDRDSRVVTDSSIAAYATKDASLGNLHCYLTGDTTQYAGKTLSMTFTAESDLVYTSANKLYLRMPYQSSNTVLAESSAPSAWDGGYFASITIPEDFDETALFDIVLYGRNFSAGDEIKIDNIMVYEGTEPLPYEPYGKYIKR